MSGAESSPSRRPPRGLAPLLLVSAVVVLVALGQARGLWLSNLHNGLLALAFTFVGAYVLFQRPGHREGRLFLATGAVEAVMFFGRQVGHSPGADGGRWLGWLGVWPLAIGLALTTLSVMAFPDGRLPSRRWRWVAAVVVAVALVCSTLSAIWPVEYAAAAVTTAHPFHQRTPALAGHLWSALAHPAYVAFEVVWVAAVAARWRTAGARVRVQLAWLVGAASASVVALLVGLAAWGTPRPGVLAATLVPVAAGWAIVHGQQVAAYSALSWLSRLGGQSADLSTELARVVAEALGAPGATVWMGAEDLHAVGVWPDPGGDIAPTTLTELAESPRQHVRVVSSGGAAGGAVGAVSVIRSRADHLSLAEDRLLEDLAAQAALVIERNGLADLIARERRAGHLEGLSARERDVLELMARGLSNAAICEELHLSIKTVEPVVGTIFTKLGLHADSASNRRVLAVLAYLRS